MSAKKRAILLITSLLLLVVAGVVIALYTDTFPANGSFTASRTEHAVGRRLSLLRTFSNQVLESPAGEWPAITDIPSDMVIYRYCDDTLQSWVNQFPVSNDDIRSRVLAPRILNPRLEPNSPLAGVGQRLGFFNFGPKWYLAASLRRGRVTVIYGLEIVNSQDRSSFNGVNPALRLSDKYSIRPLSYSEGYEIKADGEALFKLICERVSSTERNDFRLFSPLLYADAPFFPSLGAVLLVNLLLTIGGFIIYILRRRKLFRCVGWVLLVITVLYSTFSLRSIILNSSISLELYRYGDLSLYSILVYLSYLALFLIVPLLAGLDVKSRIVRVVYSSIFAIYFVLLSSVLGRQKEVSRVEVWADRITVNRDIALELQLKSVEKGIEGDILISTLSHMKSSSSTIRSRLAETYLRRVLQSHDIKVYTASDIPPRLDGGEPIADGSHFVYFDTPGGPSYAGMFLYGKGSDIASVLIVIEQRDDKTDRGYARIFSFTPPGKVSIPSQYSYSYYKYGQQVSCKGNYPYATSTAESETRIYDHAGYIHFSNSVSDSEQVIISRPKIGPFNHITEGMLLFLAAFISITLLNAGRTGKEIKFPNSFRRRMTSLVMGSLVVTLVAMAAVSVLFVVSRNDSNLRNLMSDKIGYVRTSLESTLRSEAFAGDFRTPEFIRYMERTASSANTDITLFGPDGRVIFSTSPYVYETMLLDGRMNGNAYREIVYEGRRYCFNTESASNVVFQNMYAPLLASDGSLMAIVCSPYNRESYDFEEDAVNHSLTVVSFFLILMLVARMLTKTILGKMLGPLNEMGDKMRLAGVDTLEYIRYDNEDEISSLVQSYNRMVSSLAESTTRLAQAERDKAWSGMARQVAHEIKNPLTPMKLQIQRIIRLKEKGDTSWVDKFDEMSRVILDHIDILTDTANQFSTFAKLYTEEPTEIDLDNMLQEEISMFDSSSGVEFEYRGLEGSRVSGPKPQLIRVVVNLLGNAVQAVPPEGGKVLVSLRHSVADGYYDIVVEDNGAGVSEENVDKLFTPNFTTKSGGSGLGLAISRSILEKCGATISYSRSFCLGGACFTVRYPKIGTISA